MSTEEWITVQNKKKPENVKIPQTIHMLSDNWVLWYHDLKKDQWDMPSYDEIFTFNTVEDFWICYNNVTDVNNGMYYLMRKGYPPIWDHEINLNGGGWTFRLDKKYANNFWTKLSCFCVGETLSSISKSVIGISISPKMRFVTVRIWTKSSVPNTSEFNSVRQITQKDDIVIDINNARFIANRDAAK